jgi:hypothetical protein
MSISVRHRKLRSRLAFSCVGLMALCAVVMYFDGGRKSSAAMIAGQTVIAALLAYTAAKRNREPPG